MISTPRPHLHQAARRRWGQRALALTAGGWLGVGLASAVAKEVVVATGERVAWPELRLLDGRVLAAPALRQRATVLVFFSTTCPFCKRHNQHVQKLASASASAGLALQVLGVAQDRSADDVRRYLAQQGLRFDVTLDEQPLRATLSPRRVIPLTCVLDREGRLRELIPGEMFEEDVLGLARWAST